MLLNFLSGLLNEPKWGHLKYLHKVIKQCEAVLLSADSTVYWPGKNLEVNVIWFYENFKKISFSFVNFFPYFC